MKIIASGRAPKDYYDFLQGVYGIDKLIVYDRRDCTLVNPQSTDNANLRDWFSTEANWFDRKKEMTPLYNCKKVEICRKRNELRDWRKLVPMGRIFHFMLEIGQHQYFFEVERYIDEDGVLRLEYSMVEHREVSIEDKKSKAPIGICPFTFKEPWLRNEGEFIFRDGDLTNMIDNPILCCTFIPKVISPYDVWNQLYSYISATKDVEIKDGRTDEQHAESHGFDRKDSFRNTKNRLKKK